jgi:hypothetical protein
MRTRNSIACTGTMALLFAGFLVPPTFARVGDAQDPQQVSKLLAETKTMAFQLKEDAVTMETFTRMNVSLQSQAVAINEIKDHVNALARQVAILEEAKVNAAPWQKTAIDRIMPFIDELGGYTTAAIEHINGDRKHTLAEYQDYLVANADYATDLATMIGEFVDYGNTRQRLDRLAAKLEVTAPR